MTKPQTQLSWFGFILNESERNRVGFYHSDRVIQFVKAVHNRQWPMAHRLYQGIDSDGGNPELFAEELAALAGIAIAGLERSDLSDFFVVYQQRKAKSASTVGSSATTGGAP